MPSVATTSDPHANKQEEGKKGTDPYRQIRIASFKKLSSENTKQLQVMIEFLNQIHDRGTKAYLNNEYFLLNPLIDGRFISNLLAAYRGLLFKGGDVADREGNLKAITAVIEEYLPVNFLTKTFSKKYYANTKPNGFCFYNSLMQLEANWINYQTTNEFFSMQELKKHQLPLDAEEVLQIFNKEKLKLLELNETEPLPLTIVDINPEFPTDTTFIEVLNNVIREISTGGRLRNPRTNQCPVVPDNMDTWGSLHHYPYWYVSRSTPFMLFNTISYDERYSTSKKQYKN